MNIIYYIGIIGILLGTLNAQASITYQAVSNIVFTSVPSTSYVSFAPSTLAVCRAKCTGTPSCVAFALKSTTCYLLMSGYNFQFVPQPPLTFYFKKINGVIQYQFPIFSGR